MLNTVNSLGVFWVILGVLVKKYTHSGMCNKINDLIYFIHRLGLFLILVGFFKTLQKEIPRISFKNNSLEIRRCFTRGFLRFTHIYILKLNNTLIILLSVNSKKPLANFCTVTNSSYQKQTLRNVVCCRFKNYLHADINFFKKVVATNFNLFYTCGSRKYEKVKTGPLLSPGRFFRFSRSEFSIGRIHV